MPTKETYTTPIGLWTSREAYLLGLVCLLSGLVMGYLFHGSSAPVANTVAAAGTPGSSAPATMPNAQALNLLAAPMLGALKAEPKNFDILAQLGNLYYDHHEYAEAIQYYERALALRPREINVRTDLGTAYWYAGFPEKAVAQYQESLQVDPQHANTLFNLGVVSLEGLHDAAGAIAAFERLLKSNPSAAQRERAMAMTVQAREQLAAK